LDLKRWFTDDLRRLPRAQRYDSGLPRNVYLLLTADLERDAGLINTFLRDRSLVLATDTIREAVASRPQNRVFTQNFQVWEKAVGGGREVGGDQPDPRGPESQRTP